MMISLYYIPASPENQRF